MFPRANPFAWGVAALFAALPAKADPDTLPVIERWRFEHPIKTLQVGSAQDLGQLFADHSFSLPAIRDGQPVPRVYLRRLVDDLHHVAPAGTREALFIRIVLPLVARANAKIAEERRALAKIATVQARGGVVSPAQAAWLDALAERYGGDPKDLGGLLVRVDTIPASLAVAQAIDESGWGTSPLAQETNGMFGEHAVPGSAPEEVRVPGANVDVAAFPTLLDGVLAYMTNVNRHRAYARLRALRAQHRRDGRHPDGFALAEGLRDYSARGISYVRDLQRLIRAHRLEAFDAARLAQESGVVLVQTNR
jgi:Bax protein